MPRKNNTDKLRSRVNQLEKLLTVDQRRLLQDGFQRIEKRCVALANVPQELLPNHVGREIGVRNYSKRAKSLLAKIYLNIHAGNLSDELYHEAVEFPEWDGLTTPVDYGAVPENFLSRFYESRVLTATRAAVRPKRNVTGVEHKSLGVIEMRNGHYNLTLYRSDGDAKPQRSNGNGTSLEAKVDQPTTAATASPRAQANGRPNNTNNGSVADPWNGKEYVPHPSRDKWLYGPSNGARAAVTERLNGHSHAVELGGKWNGEVYIPTRDADPHLYFPETRKERK